MTTEHLLQTPSLDMRAGYDRLRLIPTSEKADIYLIRSHVAYWCGHKEAERAEIHASRGHSYRLVVYGARYVVRIVDHYDHRNGVAGFQTTLAGEPWDTPEQRQAQLMFS